MIRSGPGVKMSTGMLAYSSRVPAGIIIAAKINLYLDHSAAAGVDGKLFIQVGKKCAAASVA